MYHMADIFKEFYRTIRCYSWKRLWVFDNDHHYNGCYYHCNNRCQLYGMFDIFCGTSTSNLPCGIYGYNISVCLNINRLPKDIMALVKRFLLHREPNVHSIILMIGYFSYMYTILTAILRNRSPSILDYNQFNCLWCNTFLIVGNFHSIKKNFSSCGKLKFKHYAR